MLFQEWLKQCTAANDTSLTSQHSSILPVSSLPWLIHLLSDRLTDIRFCGWAISTALVCDKVGQQLVINEFQSLPGGLWAAALGVVLDDKECFAVRSQVKQLFHYTNSCTQIDRSFLSEVMLRLTGLKDNRKNELYMLVVRIFSLLDIPLDA